MEYMWNEEFSRYILPTILQCKLNIGSNVDLNKADDITPNNHGTEEDNMYQIIQTMIPMV